MRLSKGNISQSVSFVRVLVQGFKRQLYLFSLAFFFLASHLNCLFLLLFCALLLVKMPETRPKIKAKGRAPQAPSGSTESESSLGHSTEATTPSPAKKQLTSAQKRKRYEDDLNLASSIQEIGIDYSDEEEAGPSNWAPTREPANGNKTRNPFKRAAKKAKHVGRAILSTKGNKGKPGRKNASRLPSDPLQRKKLDVK